ncbi:hypothetical protein HMPREF1318_2982 [Actinomyces massiliensis F0489]|uniref:Uncharacterized protein n=1 Tax=Actinomyces massiliensis F0489 TaxID=1125718 RepID=J0WEI1_9ACTO|nr:hypothetical protein HMPREF1318_2982 [Actinomyces massiliensis F0489]
MMGRSRAGRVRVVVLMSFSEKSGIDERPVAVLAAVHGGGRHSSTSRTRLCGPGRLVAPDPCAVVPLRSGACQA